MVALSGLIKETGQACSDIAHRESQSTVWCAFGGADLLWTGQAVQEDFTCLKCCNWCVLSALV